MIPLSIDWTPLANTQLDGMYEYLAGESLTAADRQIEIVLGAVDRLVDFPERGRPGRCKRTRELVVSGTPYIAAYRLRKSVIEVLAVIHGARRWPATFDGEERQGKRVLKSRA